MSLSGDEAEVQDENLLAAAVILRFYEEIDAPLVGVDDETYLRGTQVFLEAQTNIAVATRGLQNAALWVGFRQEFHSAFIKQRPFRFELGCCASSTYGCFTSADDSTWANRIIFYCAETLNFCYGNESHDPERHARLFEYTDRWFESKPTNFDPVYDKPADSSGKRYFLTYGFLVTVMVYPHG
ncbi:hypothetical protein N7481_004948 [Penicillium waksmanii]|uniref:uncharacterized protein n=1 Tax=Penicillium waksmanii TaxID=69791 RepID=UPI002549B4A6|nr:uncharacterized protein N7481_004948 [Penicillium waksmanii]KAJ5982849.1 hypothetical protein N7481_004948 [Penicillium waksmanii]